MMSGMTELDGFRRKQAETKGFERVFSRKECPVFFSVSGFQVPNTSF
jgi:hypothetical protein